MTIYRHVNSLKDIEPLKPLKIAEQSSADIYSEISTNKRKTLSPKKKKFFEECVSLYEERQDAKKSVYNV
ncbi:hypothetical protein [Priestia megaterium]|uniref:hypothetical protein n=1 Tax=Priestia megaterium TaxID=1404 RepID=UPI0031746437